jgi:hypothetical protein
VQSRDLSIAEIDFPAACPADCFAQLFTAPSVFPYLARVSKGLLGEYRNALIVIRKMNRRENGHAENVLSARLVTVSLRFNAQIYPQFL